MPLDFHFLRPLWLIGLLPAVYLLWRLSRADAQADVWRSLVDPHLLPRLLTDAVAGGRRWPLALLGLAWLLVTLALAGPVWERLPQPVYQARQYRVLALDLSPSMNATDMSPSRLAHARYELLDLLDKEKEGQTALIAYGTEPYIVSPLTADSRTIAAQVPHLETTLLPAQGERRTDLALQQAGELLRQAGAPEGRVILLTDGLSHPAAAAEAARKLRERGYPVSILGFGSVKGAPIPLAKGGFSKDASGAIRLARQNADALRSLASAGGGKYVAAGPDDRDIEALSSPGSAGPDKSSVQQDVLAQQWREEGPWLLLALLPLVALGFRRGWLSPLLLVIVLLPPPDAQAFGWQDLWWNPDQQASRHWQQGAAEQAARTFERPDWRAAAQYRSGDYQAALETLQDQSGGAADYNEGNTLARLGKYEDALGAYQRALDLNPKDADARHNRDLVEKLLEQQEQKQQSSSDQDQSQGQQQQSDQQQPQSGQGDKGQGGDQQQQQARSEQDEQGQSGQQQDREAQGQSARHDSQQSQVAEQEQGEQQQKKAQASAGSDIQDQAEESESKAQVAQTEPTAEDNAQARQTPATSQPDPLGTSAAKPGLADLMGDPSSESPAAESQQTLANAEDSQAMEQVLRRVEDDPSGLLRQRFLLQHLRRTGQLP
ncbi:MAG: VWA domain-containing protein [Chromatiales bacterium]|nr:VWA domain-containing protein [Chromatiales bacterium]